MLLMDDNVDFNHFAHSGNNNSQGYYLYGTPFDRARYFIGSALLIRVTHSHQFVISSTANLKIIVITTNHLPIDKLRH